MVSRGKRSPSRRGHVARGQGQEVTQGQLCSLCRSCWADRSAEEGGHTSSCKTEDGPMQATGGDARVGGPRTLAAAPSRCGAPRRMVNPGTKGACLPCVLASGRGRLPGRLLRVCMATVFSLEVQVHGRVDREVCFFVDTSSFLKSHLTTSDCSDHDTSVESRMGLC